MCAESNLALARAEVAAAMLEEMELRTAIRRGHKGNQAEANLRKAEPEGLPEAVRSIQSAGKKRRLPTKSGA